MRPLLDDSMLVDSHCHLTDGKYQDDRWEVLSRAFQAGVGRILTICSDAVDALRVEELLSESGGKEGVPGIWGTAGIHPHEAGQATTGDLDQIRQVALRNPRIVAVGETGLDFFYDHSPRKTQEAMFRAHLELAESLDLPAVVHSRDADDLTLRILREWAPKVPGVLHCFSGGEELLRAALELGWMVSFTGIITFGKYGGQDLVRSVPPDRLMVETDGPYLAPTPYRGRRNEPAYVRRVAESMAEIRGEHLEVVQGYTTENARRFFGLSE